MIFPLAAIPIAILLNGTPLPSYNHAYLRRGRIEAPVAPFVTRIADRIEYRGAFMVITRGSTQVRFRAQADEPRSLQAVYIPIVPVLRSLGAHITFDPLKHTLDVRFAARYGIEPFQPSQPRVSPTAVFTPEPVVTPRPVYTGLPHPRRTPIVITTSRP